MKTLKDREVKCNFKYVEAKAYLKSDVRQKVLEFEDYLNGDERNIQRDSLIKKFKEIFGDFEK